MAALTVRQKYPLPDEPQANPKSLRLDHPDFGDVHRTVYAKGVITDFERKADDLPWVYSKVKVRIGDTDYADYIPLFFHPKAQYWDDDTFQATDFNEAGGYFERAWMSFRGEEEVAVLMQPPEDQEELVPVAVIAFTDGVPRIGENILKIICPQTTGYYEMNDYGSEVFDLPVVDRGFVHVRLLPLSAGGAYGEESWQYGAENEAMTGPDGIDLRLEKEITAIDSDHYQDTTPVEGWDPDMQENVVDYYYYKYLIPIGPFLFVLQVFYKTVHLKVYGYVGEVKTLWSEDFYSDTQYFKASLLIYSVDNLTLATERQKTMLQRIAAPAWDEFDYAYNDLGSFLVWWANNYGDPDEQVMKQYRPDWSTVTIKVRPHTKAELIAAAMWPYEEEE